MSQMNLEKVHKFLNGQQTCVIARVNPAGGASAATVGFSHDEKLQIIIASKNFTRKVNDIRQNSNVAIVFGFEMPITVQYEGVAKEVAKDELGEKLARHFEKVPAAKRFADDPRETYLLITPTWLRYRNLMDESQTFETKDFV